MITVSVAMATYNGEKYIREQLDSLAAQEHVPAELVVTDDASTDETLAIIDEFSKIVPFPVYIHRNDRRVGYRANFMRAAALCRSELVAFCDQDDIWDPRKIAVCAETFEDSVTQMFRCSLLGLSDLWRMSLDHKEPEVTERMAHDQWFFFLAFVFGSIVHLDQHLVSYRQHGRNTYGWSAPWSVSKRTRHSFDSFRGRAERLASLEKAAGVRATILEPSNCKLTDPWRDRAALASERYRSLADLYGGRKRLYASIDAADRARAFCSILRNGGYRPKRNWGLGHKALIADLCLGLPAGHLLSGSRKSTAHSNN